MEVSTEEKPQPATNPSHEEKMPSDHENLAAELSNTNGGTELEHKLSREEVRDILQVVASTGKFWHEWDALKGMLSFHLKQVLSEYPEAKVGDDPEKPSLQQGYMDLVNRFDDALDCFLEGPPFTLQRLCEILLDARGIYPVLSKLELALEKNLSVTTTLSKSTNVYLPPQRPSPQVAEHPNEITEAGGEDVDNPHSSSEENGEVEPLSGNRDEIMTEAVVEADVQDNMTIDMGTSEDIISSAEKKSEPTSTTTTSIATISNATAATPTTAITSNKNSNTDAGS